MIYWIYLILIGFISQGWTTEHTWVSSSPGGFSVSISISSVDISIADTLTIEATLTYPPVYQPETDAMIQQLLSYEGFDAPPFYLSQKTIRQPVKTTQQGQDLLSQHLTIALLPQLPGKHFIAFQMLTFIPSDTTSADKSIEIIPELIEVNVHIPKEDFRAAFLIAPPMTLSQDLPVTISDANRRRFIENPEAISKAAAQSLILIHGKKLPWQIIPAIFVVLTILLVIKGPSRQKKGEI